MPIMLDRPARRGLRDRLWRLAEAATTPMLPTDYLDMFAPLRPGAELRGRVEQVIPETADAATLVIRPGGDWSGHVPGQFLRIGVEVNGVRHWRAYSLTHGPRADGRISITVKAVPDGIVSSYLVHRTRPGTLVHLEQAAGEFVLPPQSGKYLFVTAGSGITPVIGMLRNLFPATDSGVLRLARSRGYDIVVLHTAPTAPSSIFRKDLEALHDAGAIRLVSRFTNEQGRFEVDELMELVPDLAERHTFACGPHALLDAIEEHHARHGLALSIEQFRVEHVVPGEGGTVIFDQAGRTLEVNGATPILDAAEEAGVLMPSGCRMGICMSCVLPLKSGAVRDLRNGSVTQIPSHAPAHEWVKVQTCISAAAGECHLDH